MVGANRHFVQRDEIAGGLRPRKFSLGEKYPTGFSGSTGNAIFGVIPCV